MWDAPEQLPVRLDFATNEHAFVQAASLLALGRRVVLQSSTCHATDGQLAAIAELLETHADAVELRYFGSSRPFDARLLGATNKVRHLAIDYASAIEHVEQLEALDGLHSLTLGVARVPKADLLRRLAARTTLRSVRLDRSVGAHFDLTSLSDCPSLVRLQIEAQCDGVDSLARSKSIRHLTLREVPSSCSLAFVSTMSSLESLELVASRRADLDELRGGSMRSLTVSEVSILQAVDLCRLELQLRELNLEHLRQLETVRLGPTGSSLRVLRAIQCPRVNELSDLEHQHELEQLHLAQTGIDLRSLTAAPLPSSLKSMYFRGIHEDDPDCRALLTARGVRW